MSDPEVEPTRVDLPSVPDDDATQMQQRVTVFDEGEPPYGGPPPGGFVDQPDRRPWILVALLAAIILVLFLVLLLGGDDDDGDVDASITTTTQESTTTSPSSTSTSPTTSTTQAPTTTAPQVVTIPPAECAEAGEGESKPGLAADTVYDAWVRGDEACAATLMTPAAHDELFSRDGEGAQDQFQGCTEEDLPDPHVDCAFTYEGGATHYLMNFSDTDGWKVYDITQVAD